MEADKSRKLWYVMQTRPRRELVAASLLERHDELTIFLPEVRQPGRGGAQLAPLFPGYLFVQVDLTSSPAGALVHTPGTIGLVGFAGQPTPVADAVVEALQARVAQVNAQGGLAPHPFRAGDPVRFRSGPLQGLDAVFAGPLEPAQRVQVLLTFLGQPQQMAVDVNLLEKGSPPRQPVEVHPPRRSRGRARPIRRRT